MKVLNKLDSLDNINDGETRKLPTKTSQLTNDSGFITGYTETDPIFSASASAGITSIDITNWNNKSDFSGSYNDLTNKPTIPTVNDATLTIQKNSTTIDTFTANSSKNKTVNISVPTAVSELTNDSGFTTNTGTITKVQANGTDVASSGTANIPAATTSAYGVTQLSSSTSSTSTSLAATPSAVKSAYDLADTANMIASSASIMAFNNSEDIGDMDNLVGGTNLVDAIVTLDTALGEIISVESDSSRKSIKFSNGIMINTIRQGYSSNCSTTWGGIKASSTITTNNFLTPFDNGPLVCTGSVGTTSGNHWFMWVNGLATATKPPDFQLLRGASGTVNGILYVIAIGTWK